MKKITPATIGIVLALLIAVGGVAFYGGMRYGQSRRDAAFVRGQLPGAQFMGSTTPGGFARGGGTSGQITTLDSGSMTLTLRDGSTKTVTLPDAVAVSKTVAGGVSDLATGDQVVVTGTANADGSVNATAIQIRPTTPSAQ